MKKKKTLTLLGVIALAVLLALVVHLSFLDRSTATVVVHNVGEEEIATGYIRAFGVNYEFANILVGQTQRVSFPIRGEGTYEVIVELRSGRTLVGKGGYLTIGLPIEHVIQVNSDSIEMVTVPPR